MKQQKIAKIKKKLHYNLDKKRYEHTLGVMYIASAMAMTYEVDIDKALVAGLLHDCAKCIPGEKKIKLCKKHKLPINEFEKRNPGLLHAKLGAYIAKKEYKITDSEILDAITYHTTGRPDMTMLDKIIYIADYIEPNRFAAPNLDDVRKLAFKDIDACLYKILEDSLVYLNKKNMSVDPMTEQTFQFYKKELKKRKGELLWNNQN